MLSSPQRARRTGREPRTSTVRARRPRLTGMTCAACAARIEKVLNRAAGVHAEVNFATETAHVEYDAGKATPQDADRRRAGARATTRRRAPDPFAQPEQEAIAQAAATAASSPTSPSPRC